MSIANQKLKRDFKRRYVQWFKKYYQLSSGDLKRDSLVKPTLNNLFIACRDAHNGMLEEQERMKGEQENGTTQIDGGTESSEEVSEGSTVSV